MSVLKHHAMSTYEGENSWSSTHSRPRYWMHVSGRFYFFGSSAPGRSDRCRSDRLGKPESRMDVVAKRKISSSVDDRTRGVQPVASHFTELSWHVISCSARRDKNSRHIFGLRDLIFSPNKWKYWLVLPVLGCVITCDWDVIIVVQRPLTILKIKPYYSTFSKETDG
jgi:hypothetical protein